MSAIKISSPQQASYPLTIKKTFIAPDDRIQKGETLYQLEDGQGRQIQIRCPKDGRVHGNPLPTGTRLEQAAIILELEVAEAMEATAKVVDKVPEPEPVQQAADKVAAPKQSAPPSGEHATLPLILLALFALSLTPLLAWVALHITHSLAHPGIRYGALVGAFVLPWFLCFVLPNKKKKFSAREIYAGGLIWGSLIALIPAVASFFIPVKWLSRLDNQWVHRQVAPLTFAPLVQTGKDIYLLGHRIANKSFFLGDEIALSNGGLFGTPLNMMANHVVTSYLWDPNGEQVLQLEAYRAKVFLNAEGETEIALYPVPQTVPGGSSSDRKRWSIQVIDNEGLLLRNETVEAVKEGYEPPLPSRALAFLEDYDGRVSDGEALPKLYPKDED